MTKMSDASGPSTEGPSPADQPESVADMRRPAMRFGGTAERAEVVAQLAVGNATFWVEDESPPHENFSPESLGGPTSRMLLIVEDPVTVMERAVAAGASQIHPLIEEHGWSLGRIKDPFGHHWEIGKPLTPWPPSRGG
jgi:PhnB protein